MGFGDYVEALHRGTARKLFPELSVDGFGYFSGKFSKWFSRFLEHSGAAEDRTCFHSFRHSFRDALREGQVDREVALALGGWTSGSSNDTGAVADS